jgi:COP9 signalosome complex subunit 4
MASASTTTRLAELEDSSVASNEKPSGYHKLLEQISQTSALAYIPHDLAAFIDSILRNSLGIVAARPLLGAYVEALRQIPSSGIRIECGTYALRALESRVTSFEEQDASIRDIVADAYQEQEEYVEAANVLKGIQLESTQRNVPDDAKVRVWIRICRLYLEEDDTTNAEGYLNRAKNVLNLYQVEDKELSLMFQLSQARILDARRKFLDASQAYYTFSLYPELAEEERAISLSKAIICAVLAPAGPLRSRALGKLFKDERAAGSEEFGILEKMFLDRLISTEEVARFADKLAPHQLALTADGSTVLAKAVIEHNLLAASRLYNNIGITELGTLLGLDNEKAEDYACRMLEQGRLVGHIDQIDSIIYFSTSMTTTNNDMPAASGTGDRQLRQWDRNVQALAEDVERVASLLQLEVPVSVVVDLVRILN